MADAIVRTVENRTVVITQGAELLLPMVAASAAARDAAEGFRNAAQGFSAAASASAGNAAASADLAALAAVTAPNVYPDTASGLAAVAEGETFWVQGVDAPELYRNVSGAAVLVGEIVTRKVLAKTPSSRLLASKLLGMADTPPAEVVIVRLNADYLEFAAYHAMDAAGSKWARLYFTNKLLNGHDGAPVLRVATISYLYASTLAAPPAENYTTGTYATAPTSTQTPTAAADTGSWTAPAMVSGVANVSRPTTPGTGATRTYSYTLAPGESKIFVLIGNLNGTNGGIGKITVKVDGTEIAPDKYLAVDTGTERIVRYVGSSGYSTGLTHLPAAALTNGTGAPQTVTILLEESATNPVGGRVYDAGLNIYNAIPYNAVGLHALGKTNATLGGIPSLEIPSPGGTVVYRFDNATRISWNYLSSSVGGNVRFTLYDSTGVEIGDYVRTGLDTYAPGNNARRAVIAEGMPKGTYYLHIFSLPTKSSASSSYRIYDGGALGQDESRPGTLGVDVMDDQDIPSSPSDATNLSENIIYGPLNIEAAFELIPAASVFGPTDAFVTGTHRNETRATDFTVTIDEADKTAAYNALAVGEMLTGTKIEVSWNTKVDLSIGSNGLGVPGTPLADVTYKEKVDRWGWHPEVSVTHTAAAKMRQNYILMLQMIGSAAERADGIENRGVGGGFDLMGFDRDKDYLLDALSMDETLTTRSAAIVSANAEYAVVATLDNEPELLAAFDGIGVDSSTRLGSVRTNTAGYLKGYVLIAGQTGTTAGFDIPPGFKWTMRHTIRPVPGDFRSALGITA